MLFLPLFTGGAENIRLAVQAARVYMAAHKGIKRPQLSVECSAQSFYAVMCAAGGAGTVLLAV